MSGRAALLEETAAFPEADLSGITGSGRPFGAQDAPWATGDCGGFSPDGSRIVRAVRINGEGLGAAPEDWSPEREPRDWSVAFSPDGGGLSRQGDQLQGLGGGMEGLLPEGRRGGIGRGLFRRAADCCCAEIDGKVWEAARRELSLKGRGILSVNAGLSERPAVVTVADLTPGCGMR